MALVVGAIIVATGAGRTRADTFSYDGGTLGTGTDWGTVTNWNADGIPGAADSILQTAAPGTATFVNLGASRQVTDLEWNTATPASFEIRGSAVDQTFTVTGTLTKKATGTLVLRGAAGGATNALAIALNNVDVFAGTLSVPTQSTHEPSITVGGTTRLMGTGTGSAPTVISLNAKSATFGSMDFSETGTNNRFYISSAAGVDRTVGVASLANGGGAGNILALASTGSTTSYRGTLNITGTSGLTTFAGQILNNAGANTNSILTVTKTGSSTQVLTGTANSYTGGTTIGGGTLLSNNASGTATGAAGGFVTVNSGGRLGGTGFVVAPTTVNNGGKLLGGDGVAASGALSLSGNVTFGDGSIIELVVGPASAHSSLARLGGAWTFDADQAFSLIGIAEGSYDNIITGLAADPGTTGAWTLANPGYAGTFTFDGSNIDLVVSANAVPEPGTLSALLGTLATLAIRRRHPIRVV